MIHPDEIAEIIRAKSFNYEYMDGSPERLTRTVALIDALTDYFEKVRREECPVIYEGGVCFFHGIFDRAAFVHIATGGK